MSLKCPYCDQEIEDEIIENSIDDGSAGRRLPVSTGEYTCGHPTENGDCGRQVGAPDEKCWQHEEEE